MKAIIAMIAILDMIAMINMIAMIVMIAIHDSQFTKIVVDVELRKEQRSIFQCRFAIFLKR